MTPPSAAFEFRPATRQVPIDLFLFLEQFQIPPFNDANQLWQLLKDFISSETCILDLFIDGERHAYALILDTEESDFSTAELALIGLRPSNRSAEILSSLVAEMKKRLESGGTTVRAISMYRWQDSPLPLETVLGAGFTARFDTVKVYGTKERVDRVFKDIPVPTTPYEWRNLTPDIEKAVYEIYQQVFTGHHELRLPDFESFVFLARQSGIPIRVLMDGKTVVAFAWLGKVNQGKDGDIQRMGRNPKYKGRGLGAAIFYECIRVLNEHGVDSYSGYVEATNETALQVYMPAGEIVTRFTMFTKEY